MSTEHSITKILENRGVEMRSKINAIRSVGVLEFSPDVCRGLISDVLETDIKIINALVTDDVAEMTLKYIIDQYFEPMSVLDLMDAYNRALELRVKFPLVAIDQFLCENENNPPKVNEDGVKVGKTGKPKKGYKKNMALSLYRENKDTITKKSEWIDLFVKEISGMTKAVANTYIHNIETKKWMV